MMALTMSNSCEYTRLTERLETLQTIQKAYTQDELHLISEMMIHLGEEIELHMSSPEDVLGPIFEELNLGNSKLGQFFTPHGIAKRIGDINWAPSDNEEIRQRGYITALDPACGSGALPLGLAAAMQEQKHDHRLKLVLTAVDVDIRCVYMAYVQFGLYGIPGVVIHGDTLRVQEWSRWYTPVYMLDKWIWRQRCGLVRRRYLEDEIIKCSDQPMYAIMRYGFDVFEKEGVILQELQRTGFRVDPIPDSPKPAPEPQGFDVTLTESDNGQFSLF